MIKKDSYARFVKSGFSLLTTYKFNSGNLYTKDPIYKSEYENILKSQETDPYCLMHEPTIYTKWWMFQGEFYMADDDLTQKVVKALILKKPEKKEKQKNKQGDGIIIPFIKRKNTT